MSVKGVGCPRCFYIQEGEFDMGQEVKCNNCHLVYPITYDEVESYKAYRLKMMQQQAKARRQEMEYEEMGLLERVARKTIKLVGLFVAILIVSGLVVVFKVNFGGSSDSNAPVYRADGTKVGTKADAQYFSSWDGSNPELVALVKKGMHDPSSFEHVETRFTDKSDTYRIMMTFRGKNGFNAVVTQTVTATLDKKTKTISELVEVK